MQEKKKSKKVSQEKIYAVLAQLVEQLSCKQQVVSSSLTDGSLCGCGGIGRRYGLKIRFPLEVRVQVPPSAPL